MLLRVGLAAVAGLGLSLAHRGYPFVAPLAPVLLLWALRHARGAEAVYLGLLCGVGEAFCIAGVLHLGTSMFLAVCATYALQRGLFAAGHALLRGTNAGAPSTLMAPALWVVIEWLHAQVPFSCPNLLGDTQHVGPFLPLARIGGTYLISFQLVWLAELTSRLVDRCPTLRTLVAPSVAWVFFFAIVRLWAWASPPEQIGSLSAVAIQGGLPTWLYAKAREDPSWRRVPESVYTSLTRRAPPADLTVWPETAIGSAWGLDSGFEGRMMRLQEERGAMLIGVVRDSGTRFVNSAVLLDGGPPRIVDKQRAGSVRLDDLTLANLFRETRLARGAGTALIPSDFGLVGVVFCVESLVPQHAAELAARGAHFLVVLADSRLRRTPVGLMHARRSILRAVETGRWVLHAGQHGYSMVIGPDGAYSEPLPPYRAATLHARLGLAAGLTPFVRLRRWIMLPALIIIVVQIMIRVRGMRRRS